MIVFHLCVGRGSGEKQHGGLGVAFYSVLLHGIHIVALQVRLPLVALICRQSTDS